MSDIENNRAIARRWLELVSSHDVDAICAMTSPTWTMHGGPPSLPSGPAGVRALFRTIGPVVQTWTIEDVIAEGDKVVVRARNSCFQESFLGIPSHGRRQLFTAMFIFHIVNGKVEETWRNADDLGRAMRLGAWLETLDGRWQMENGRRRTADGRR